MSAERFAKLPHDEWYGDYTWEYILGDGDEPGSANHEYLGADQFDPTKIAEIEQWHVEEGSYGPEHSATGMFRMEDGTYVVYTGGCDSTGWGCRDDARFTFHGTKEDAIRFGLDDRSREWFGFPNGA